MLVRFVTVMRVCMCVYECVGQMYVCMYGLNSINKVNKALTAVKAKIIKQEVIYERQSENVCLYILYLLNVSSSIHSFIHRL